MKKVVTALIEATHFFKTNKEPTKKIIGKYFPTANSAYLEDNYTTTTKILERVPYVTRRGVEVLVAEARKTSPATKITVNDLVDDSIVREIEQEGFIDQLYAKK